MCNTPLEKINTPKGAVLDFVATIMIAVINADLFVVHRLHFLINKTTISYRFFCVFHLF